jgi:hypothetical protein
MGDANFTAITKVENIPDPLLSFKWGADILPFGLPAHYLESVSLGFLNLQAKDGFFQAGTYTYSAGFHEPTPVSCTFYEDRFATTLRWIHGWKQQVKDFRSGVYGIPSQYKKTMTVTMMDNDNDPVLVITFIDIWPSETSSLELNYESTERIKISQAFSVDSIELDFKKTDIPLGL